MKKPEVQFPLLLNTDAFRATWSDWVQHRKEKRAPLTATTISRQLKKLEAMGHDRAIAALEHSITNGYTGVFEPSGGRNGSASPPGERLGRLEAPPGKYENIKYTYSDQTQPGG